MERARERLDAARELLASGWWDDAVSRAYYAMLNAARALLASRGVFPKTHAGTLAEFNRVFVATGLVERDLGGAFREGRELREEADYGFAARATNQEAEAIVQDAARLVELAERLRKR